MNTVKEAHTCAAPFILINWASSMPVGPHPNNNTRLPTSSCIRSMPCAAQAAGSSRTASRSGRSPMGNTMRAGYRQYSAMPPGTLPPYPVTFSHSCGFLRIQWKQLRHGSRASAATRSPIVTLVTFFPTAATVPAASWPMVISKEWIQSCELSYTRDQRPLVKLVSRIYLMSSKAPYLCKKLAFVVMQILSLVSKKGFHHFFEAYPIPSRIHHMPKSWPILG